MFLRDIWPLRADIQKVEVEYVRPAMFTEVYSKITEGNSRWNALEAPQSILYPWDTSSTYIKHPPFLENMVNKIAITHLIYNLISAWLNHKIYVAYH